MASGNPPQRGRRPRGAFRPRSSRKQGPTARPDRAFDAHRGVPRLHGTRHRCGGACPPGSASRSLGLRPFERLPGFPEWHGAGRHPNRVGCDRRGLDRIGGGWRSFGGRDLGLSEVVPRGSAARSSRRPFPPLLSAAGPWPPSWFAETTITGPQHPGSKEPPHDRPRNTTSCARVGPTQGGPAR